MGIQVNALNLSPTDKAVLGALRHATCDTIFASGALAIKAGSSAIVKAGSAFVSCVDGITKLTAANTDMAGITGTLATAKAAAWAFYIDSAGTLSASTKTPDVADAAAAIALLPEVPAGKAQIGFITVANATGSDFVAGTTALDAASVTTTYFNTPGPVGIGMKA